MTKLYHWRAFTAISALNAAPKAVLHFLRRHKIKTSEYPHAAIARHAPACARTPRNG